MSRSVTLGTEVKRILAAYDWRLLHTATPAEWEAFLSAVSACHEANPERPLSYAVTMAYSSVLYAACMAERTWRQHRAYSELWAWVYRRVRSRVDNDDDARDLAQEVLLTVYQERHKVTRPHGFLAWVARILGNRLQRYYKAQQKEDRVFARPKVDGDDEEEASVPSQADKSASISEVRADEAELLAVIEPCLARQAHTQRLVFIELVLRNRTISEVAAVYRLSVATLRRAWERLQHTLRRCRPLIAYLLARIPPSQRVPMPAKG
jgi:RNA polymerase sigma factor (sigma-70 family)